MRIGSIGAALAALSLVMVTACSSTPPIVDRSMAECPVCKHDGDLACVCVHVGPGTPSCECSGETYYFCSDDCREDFQAHPERYLPSN